MTAMASIETDLCECGAPAVLDGLCFACKRFGEAYHASPPFSCSPGGEWLAGEGMDPVGTTAEPMPTLPGFPFLYRGAGALIVGPTGGGRSSLVQVCAYRAARDGLRIGYLGHEVTLAEFNDRAARLATLWGDDIDDELRVQLARVRYLDLGAVVTQAWEDPDGWVRHVPEVFDVVIFDPLSAVESALGFNFEQSNHDVVRWWDRMVQPLTSKGVTVVVVDNVGHAIDARGRAKGASAKQDRADLAFSCALVASPSPGLVVRANKVRSIRSPFRRGDEWLFLRDSQTIERSAVDEVSAAFRPTHLMEKVSRHLEENSGSGKNAIRQAIASKRANVDAAIDFLVEDGFVERIIEGQKQLHRSIRPFREGDREPRPNSRASVGFAGLGSDDEEVHDRGQVEMLITSGFDRGPTEARPEPDRGPAPVEVTEAPRPGVVDPGLRASVDDAPVDPVTAELLARRGGAR